MVVAVIFWERVDRFIGTMRLMDLAEKSGIKYDTLRNMRSCKRLPKPRDIEAIASVLGVSYQDLTQESSENLCPEAQFVQDNEDARAIVRLMMRDPASMSHISALIKLALDSKLA